jgi:hypothetical protein
MIMLPLVPVCLTALLQCECLCMSGMILSLPSRTLEILVSITAILVRKSALVRPSMPLSMMPLLPLLGAAHCQLDSGLVGGVASPHLCPANQ